MFKGILITKDESGYKAAVQQIDDAVLATLNSRYVAHFQPTAEEPYITLTAHNASAQEINRAAKQAGRLRSLKEDAVIKVLNGVTTLEEAASAVMV